MYLNGLTKLLFKILFDINFHMQHSQCYVSKHIINRFSNLIGVISLKNKGMQKSLSKNEMQLKLIINLGLLIN